MTSSTPLMMLMGINSVVVGNGQELCPEAQSFSLFLFYTVFKHFNNSLILVLPV